MKTYEQAIERAAEFYHDDNERISDESKAYFKVQYGAAVHMVATIYGVRSDKVRQDVENVVRSWQE